MSQLASTGYYRLSIEAVAAEAGVGKATVYRWWPTKARLVVEALSTQCDIDPVVATGDLRVDVRALVQRSVDLITKTPLGQVLPYLAADFDVDPQARVDLLALLGPTRASHLALLYEAAGRGEFPHDIDANLILDLLAGVITYRSLMGQRPDEPHLVDQLTNLIVDRELPRAGTDENRLL